MKTVLTEIEMLVNGKRHRDGGLPAIEYNDGTKVWYVNDKPHRDGGLPAVEYNNGTKVWHFNGKLHRDGGLPAIEYNDGTKKWYVNEIKVTEQESKRWFYLPRFALPLINNILSDRCVATVFQSIV